MGLSIKRYNESPRLPPDLPKLELNNGDAWKDFVRYALDCGLLSQSARLNNFNSEQEKLIQDFFPIPFPGETSFAKPREETTKKGCISLRGAYDIVKDVTGGDVVSSV